MDEYLFQEVYQSLAPAPFDAIVAVSDDDDDDDGVVDSEEVAWSVTEDFVEALPVLRPLECKMCRSVFKNLRAQRNHVALCAFYNSPKTSEGASKKRTCAPVDLEEKRTRKRRRTAEYAVRCLLDHRDDGRVLVRWIDDEFTDTWEPVANFFDLDADGEVVSVNDHLLSYQQERGVSLMPSC